MMNREQLYYKTVDTLLEAYKQDKLHHDVCSACAVGNICGNSDLWTARFLTISMKGKSEPRVPGSWNDFTIAGMDMDLVHTETKKLILEKADALIESTGYTREELASIEYCFAMSKVKT